MLVKGRITFNLWQKKVMESILSNLVSIHYIGTQSYTHLFKATWTLSSVFWGSNPGQLIVWSVQLSAPVLHLCPRSVVWVTRVLMGNREA